MDTSSDILARFYQNDFNSGKNMKRQESESL